MLPFNKWNASLILPDRSNAWNGEQIQKKILFKWRPMSDAAQAGTTASPRQGGVEQRQPLSALALATPACCQNVWGWEESNWRSYRLCGLLWSIAALEMLLVPVCCAPAVIQMPKMCHDRVVPLLCPALRHALITVALALRVAQKWNTWRWQIPVLQMSPPALGAFLQELCDQLRVSSLP